MTMCSTFIIKIMSKIRRVLKLSKSYKNCFDFKNMKILFEYENKNHVIDLILDAKSLYKLLYMLFKIEFDLLKNYLLKNLILNCIRKFMNRANALMLFIFKKSESFRFYVNYKELNALIIKNKCLFLLIDETLNRFMNAAYFIKLDFKNAYYRIRICKSDE